MWIPFIWSLCVGSFIVYFSSFISPISRRVSWLSLPTHLFIVIINFSEMKMAFGVPWWHNRLKDGHCHCRGLDCCLGTGLIPGPGTSIGCRQGKEKKKRKKEKGNVLCCIGPYVEQWCFRFRDAQSSSVFLMVDLSFLFLSILCFSIFQITLKYNVPSLFFLVFLFHVVKYLCLLFISSHFKVSL